MAVQAVVQDGVEVLQATPMEGVDEVPLPLGLSKLGIHLIAVHDLKEVVGRRNCSPRHPREFLDLLVLKHRKEHKCWLMGLLLTGLTLPCCFMDSDYASCARIQHCHNSEGEADSKNSHCFLSSELNPISSFQTKTP